MKKIIGGKTYNTDTAALIGKWDNGLPYNDLAYCGESLYKTKNGRYFVYGVGGPMSKYSISTGNTTSGSENIMAIDICTAQKWAERYLTVEEYMNEFDVEEA